jgi:hypothetical protein
MNGPKAADAIFNKLTFKRLGTDEWIDVYRLGQELGFSKEQMREALAQFEKDKDQLELLRLLDRQVGRLGPPSESRDQSSIRCRCLRRDLSLVTPPCFLGQIL